MTTTHEVNAVEPTTVILKRHWLNFTPHELGTYILSQYGREPTWLDSLVIEWSIAANRERQIKMSINGTVYVDTVVQPWDKEQVDHVDLWMDDDPEELAVMDTKRMIALGLTHYYKEKITGLWDR